MPISISYVMNVLNGQPFLTAQLRSIYPYAHQIVIVEGAYTRFSHAATVDGHSLDDTLNAIRAFPDPEHKITLIVRDGFWEERCEMCNGFLPPVSGDVIWQVDADEFYLPETHRAVARWFESDPTLDRVSFRVREFFASPRYEIAGAAHAAGLGDVRRVHRFAPGDRWNSQRPPTLAHADGSEKPIRNEIPAAATAADGHFLFHPTLLFRKQFFDKYQYYRQMWKNIPQSDEWLEATWDRFENPLNIEGLGEMASWLERYDGPLPPDLATLCEQASRGALGEEYRLRDNADIERYLDTPLHRADCRAGHAVNALLSGNYRPRSVLAFAQVALYTARHRGSSRGRTAATALRKVLDSVKRRIARVIRGGHSHS